VWAWCNEDARWYYMDDKDKPYCPVCGALPIAFSAEQPTQPPDTAVPHDPGPPA
jgi:hypothetical protein